MVRWADIESLYTNIDTRLGLEAVRECFNRHPDPCRPDDLILQLLEINLTRNDFEFDKQCYLQIQGTAMGIWMTSLVSGPTALSHSIGKTRT
ncbi:uncharacterized protein LOC113662967 isoform X6 [Tachysurus fulvidraco]|uniref:uncharacterized protein LOC113662967 isoform X6 n=1 Tax=Tachysurus fulvidraco TaxID=1234273 RepID=UPI001FEE871E|nr:uncharacterized protein LOC113662967 isoform X6 [Tachysurus fulvidraco]